MRTFQSEMQVREQFAVPGQFTQDQVKNEPMFFNADIKFAYERGGPITKAFIKRFLLSIFARTVASMAGEDEAFEFLLKKYGHGYVFDSRSHMLKKGWFPCIPGFHHDDVARGKDGQPDYNNMAYYSQHCMGLINGDICPTQFALGDVEVSDVPAGEIIYKRWHEDVVKAIANPYIHVKTESAVSDHLIFFDWRSFHQGVRAIDEGWRWFGRVSWSTDRVKNVSNEFRNQVQVYLEFPMEGW